MKKNLFENLLKNKINKFSCRGGYLNNTSIKTKGFTLIELLAVIVVLAVIAMIAVPTVLNIIEKAREGAAKSSAVSYIKATETYIVTSKLDNKMEQLQSGESYTTSKLNNLVELKGTKPTDGNVVISNKNDVASAKLIIDGYTIIYDGENYYIYGKEDIPVTPPEPVLYKEDILNGTDPIISNNLIPITIENDGTVKKADLYSEWYKYEDKKWANAVILKDENVTYKGNEIIPEDNIESYFVWVPRYKYKIFDEGNYTSVIEGKPTESKSQPIDIQFENKETTVSNGSTVGTYLTHPAFTSFDVNGLWVGKFETGYDGATTPATAEVNSNDSNKIIVKPNVYSWRGINVKNIFEVSYNYKRANDSHMMKNTEWGAVAYLSHSEYGINKEVNINNNSASLTGYSAAEGTDQSSHPGTYEMTSDITLLYNTETGYKATTTGNITGIYDMSGGAWEYMAAYMQNNLKDSGFTSDPASAYGIKYFDVYSDDSTGTSYNKRILGDATGEMGPFYNYTENNGTNYRHNGWYADHSSFVETGGSWFHRGGRYYDGVLASQFYFAGYTGIANGGQAFRIVLAK